MTKVNSDQELLAFGLLASSTVKLYAVGRAKKCAASARVIRPAKGTCRRASWSQKKHTKSMEFPQKNSGDSSLEKQQLQRRRLKQRLSKFLSETESRQISEVAALSPSSMTRIWQQI